MAHQFDREQWLARTVSRRHDEWKEKHAAELIRISPMMMQKLRQGRLATPDYQNAIHAYRKNDGAFTTWLNTNVKRRDPAVNPYKNDSFYQYTYTPKAYRSPTKKSPAKLPPLTMGHASAGGGTTASPAAAASGAPLKRTFSDVTEVHYEEDNGSHVDHSLEMFRTGVGAGGGAGHASVKGYRFDGDVAKVGAGDPKPVSAEEIEAAHDIIRDKLKGRFATFRRAFREIDENNSGRVTKLEALRMLMMLNLTNVREKVMAKLCDVMDPNGNGVEYEEFCQCTHPLPHARPCPRRALSALRARPPRRAGASASLHTRSDPSLGAI